MEYDILCVSLCLRLTMFSLWGCFSISLYSALITVYLCLLAFVFSLVSNPIIWTYPGRRKAHAKEVQASFADYFLREFIQRKGQMSWAQSGHWMLDAEVNTSANRDHSSKTKAQKHGSILDISTKPASTYNFKPPCNYSFKDGKVFCICANPTNPHNICILGT